MNHQQTVDQRTTPRFDASAMPALKCISRVGGGKVKLINISRGGALIESRERISLGSSIAVRLTIDSGVHFIKGRIIRSRGFLKGGRVFQSAITFREDFKILPANVA